MVNNKVSMDKLIKFGIIFEYGVFNLIVNFCICGNIYKLLLRCK